jgi:hypothetical protein
MKTPPTFARRLAHIATVALLFFFTITPLSDPLSFPQLAHLVLAMGAFPLIIGAMIYFTPTLTRSAPPQGWIGWWPILAFLVGGIAYTAVSQELNLIYVAAPLGIAVCGGLLFWMNGRIKNSLGDPHPGLAWYQGAIFFLIIGLLAIILAQLQPEWWWTLRNIHQQINLMGFIGLTTIGTLQVFLPTVAHYPDPTTGLRLKQHLKYALIGTIFLAAGAAQIAFCSLIGRAIWLIPLLALAHSVWINQDKMQNSSGAALPIFGALLGFIGLTILGETTTLPYLFAFFLFPLVTGALSHLLPLWWWPGFPAPNREKAQAFLGKVGILLLLGFYGAGIASIWNQEWGGWIALGTLILFAGRLLVAKIKFRESKQSGLE